MNYLKGLITTAISVIALTAVMTVSSLIGCDGNDQRIKINLEDVATMEELTVVPSDKPAGNKFLFGFDLRSAPQEDARQYLPFLNYLEKATGLHFKLHFPHKNADIVDELGQGIVHFAAIGAGSYINAKKKYDITPIALGLNLKNRAEYQAMIVVAPPSPIKTIQDLPGKKLALGNKKSTQGSLIPRIVLAQNKLSMTDLASYTFTGSHQNCADAVLAGSADACGLQDTMAKDLAGKGLVRIIHTSDYYPSSSITASNKISPAIIAKVKQALLAFQPKGRDAEGLYHWDKTEMPFGFIAAKGNDYAQLEKWSRKLEPLAESERAR